MTARRHTHPRGMALLLVVAVLAIATALGYVMLSSATLQNRAAGNQVRLATADYLAESGINLAMYYLQYPDRAPTLNAQGYWAGTGGDLAIASSIDGTVNVTVTQDASDIWSYEVVSTAKAGTNSETKITRTTGARLYLRNSYSITKAAVFNGNISVPGYWSVQGDVWTSKRLAIPTGSVTGSITGSGYCATKLTGTGYTQPIGGWKSLPNADWPSPSGTNDLNLYTTYSWNDASFSADTISAGSLGSVTKVPTATNPAGVLYKDATSGGAMVLNADTVIYGTLVVKGDLQIKGANVVIYPQAGFPALIVTGTLEIFQPKYSLTANGVVFVGTTVKSNGSRQAVAADNSTFTVNGALAVGTVSGTPITTPWTVTTVIKYDAAKAVAPELTSVQHVSKGVSIARWGLP